MAGGNKGNSKKTGGNLKIKHVNIKLPQGVKPRKANTNHSSNKTIKASLPKSSNGKSTQEPKSKTTKTSTDKSNKTSDLIYDRAAVKRANERLRKMEKVYTYRGSPLAEYNTAYQTRKHDLEVNEKSGGSIFKRDTTGIGVRYLSEKEFNKLNKTDKKRFIKNLQNWLDADSSQKSSFEKAVKDNYNNMNSHYNLAGKGISADDWLEVLRVYHTKIVPTDNSHYGSKVIIEAIQNLDIPNLSPKDLEKAMQYIISGRQDKIEKEWWQKNY